MILRKQLFSIIDKQLSELGYGDEIDVSHGGITLNVQFDKAGNPTVVIRDREIVDVK